MNPLLDLLGQPAHPRPRRQRLTMVLDKSLGCAAAQDLVDTAGPWIDTVKLGWGSAALYPEATLRRKVAIYRDAGLSVCPGGTFVETLFEAGRVAQALPLLKDLGFNALEVSNGIHPRMTRRDKQRIITLAANAGFLTTSEVGRKLPDEDRRLTPAQRMAEIRADLAAGADKVIIEARESGTSWASSAPTARCRPNWRTNCSWAWTRRRSSGRHRCAPSRCGCCSNWARR